MSARVAASIPTIAFCAGATALVLFCIALWLESLALTNPRGWLVPAPNDAKTIAIVALCTGAATAARGRLASCPCCMTWAPASLPSTCAKAA